MKQKRKALTAALRILLPGLLFVLLNLWLLYGLGELKEYEDLLSLSYSPGAVTETAFTQWRENEGENSAGEAAAWKACGEGNVLSETTGRSQNVSCYKVKGQPGAIFGRALIRGRYFTEGETGVCMIDRDTAWLLFGSDHAEGLKIMLEGETGTETFQVAGILEGNIPLMILPAGKNTCYDAVTVRKKDTGRSSNLIASGMEAAMGAADGQRIDGKLYVVTACLLYGLTNALILLLFARRAGRACQDTCLAGIFPQKISAWYSAGFARVGKRLLCLICITGAVLAVLLGAWLADPGSDYLPAYWSDFEFFGSLFKEKASQIRSLAAHQEFSAWQNLFQVWQRTICGEFLLLIVASASLRNYTARKINLPHSIT